MKIKTKNLVILSVFSSIILILAFTPIGYIHLGIIKITIIHIPVILGSILLGAKQGAFLGFLFGLTSLISNTITPAILSFVFSPLIPTPGMNRGSALALIICFVPRILVGIVPYYVFHLLQAVFKKKRLLLFGISGVIGSLINTILVMTGIYFMFKDSYAAANNISIDAVFKGILGIIFMNGVPEAILAGIVTAGLCRVLYNNRQVKEMVGNKDMNNHKN